MIGECWICGWIDVLDRRGSGLLACPFCVSLLDRIERQRLALKGVKVR
jgi:hypothetical protein